jgi:protein SCO1/2
VGAAAVLALGAVPAAAQRTDYTPRMLEGIEIRDRAGDFVPADVRLVDQDGRAVTVGEYLNRGRPLIVNLVYFECPMLCSLVINGFVEGAKDLDWSPGREYEVLSVSFDPADTPELGRLKRANYLEALDKEGAEAGWHFLVGESDEVARLAESVGFPYRYDEEQGQFAHAAGIFVLTPDGRISRTLYGIDFAKKDLKFSLIEASQGRLGTPMEKLLLYCFHYDADAEGYVLVAVNLMKLGGALTVLVLGGFLGVQWMRERRRGWKAA